MWRFTRNNGITEGFHNKMELINRQPMASATSKTTDKESRCYVLRRFGIGVCPRFWRRAGGPSTSGPANQCREINWLLR